MRVMDTSTTALGALSVSLQASANNLVNATTNGFRQSDIRFDTGAGDQNMRLSESRKDATRSSPVEAPVHPIVGREYEQHMGWVESSNKDVPRELVNMIAISSAWQPNATVIRSADEVLGSLFNEII